MYWNWSQNILCDFKNITNVNSNNITVNKKDKDICKEPQSIMMKEKNLQYNQLNNFHQILMTTILSKGDLLVSGT